MIRLAICDDMPDQLETLRDLTAEYFAGRNLDVEILVFSHPDALLEAVRRELFHIYLLDIVMPMMNGIQLGRQLRLSDMGAQIIFTTTEPQFALDAFAANPVNYLIKPVARERLFETLSLAVSRVEDDRGGILCIRTTDAHQSIAFSDLVYCEYRRHQVIYTLEGGERVTTASSRIPFSEHVLPLIGDHRFIQPHTSYVINLFRVSRMTRDTFEMQGGHVIPIAQKRKHQAREAYLAFILRKGGSIV